MSVIPASAEHHICDSGKATALLWASVPSSVKGAIEEIDSSLLSWWCKHPSAHLSGTEL